MGKINKSKSKNIVKNQNSKKKSKDKQLKDAKFKVTKSKGTKDKRNRSINFAKNDYQKKKLQNQQFESIKNLNAKLDQLQGSIRSSVAENNFERLKARENKPIDLDQAIDAINSL